MKRSEINHALRETIVFFNRMQFALPAWALWTLEDWRSTSENVSEIVACGLGWDITDFGSGDFQRVGLINFNLRNGIVNQTAKPYCEKIIVVQENQITPLHTHHHKLEDIINRGRQPGDQAPGRRREPCPDGRPGHGQDRLYPAHGRLW